jgi:hypothetical protein
MNTAFVCIAATAFIDSAVDCTGRTRSLTALSASTTKGPFVRTFIIIIIIIIIITTEDFIWMRYSLFLFIQA